MKIKYILLLVAILGISLGLSAQSKDDKPQIEFAQKVHDFGAIVENGGPVTCEFTFTNTGTQPLIIIAATATCGCTNPKYPKQPIKPGKTGKIEVTYNPKGRPGAFDKQITVRSNSKKNAKTHLRIIGVVNK